MNHSRPLLEEVCMLIVFVMAIVLTCLVPTVLQAQSNRNSRVQPVANAQKHAATLRANDSPEGSRVSIYADATLDEYEAYRRGDRFYVKLPSTEVSQAQTNLRARGFEDVTVKKNGNNTLLSFHLQPGTTARVEQRGNHLDVVFTTPGGSQSSVITPSAASSASPAPANTLDSAPATVTGNTKGQSAVSNSGTPPSTASGIPSPSSSSPAAPINQNPSSQQNPNDSWLGSGGWRTGLKSYGERARLNWLPIGIGLALTLLVIAVLLSRRAKSQQRRDIVSLPRKLKDNEESAVKTAPIVAGARIEQLSDIKPVTASSREPSSPKSGVPTVPRVRVGNARIVQERVDVASAQAEANSILTGGNYDKPVTGAVDTGTREVIATELLSALAGRNPERRDRARDAFIKSGYFDDATRDLRVAEAPAERASAARKLSLVRDTEATPHLVAALEDEAPEVRRAAVEALADLRDPAAIAPLNELLSTERDRKLPQSVIRHAIEACATVDQPTTPVRELEPFAPPNMTSAPIEADREVIEI